MISESDDYIKGMVAFTPASPRPVCMFRIRPTTVRASTTPTEPGWLKNVETQRGRQHYRIYGMHSMMKIIAHSLVSD